MANNLAGRLKALEATRAMKSVDLRWSSDAELACFMSETPIEELRTELAGFPEIDFALLVTTIRQHVPAYGGNYDIS